MSIRRVLISLSGAYVLVSLAVFPVSAGSAEWPQYRGINRDGVTASASSSLSWPGDGPRVLWHQEAGAGFSQLAVDQNAVFTGIADDENEFIVRLAGESGDEVWRASIGGTFQDQFGNGPRATPTVDGDTVYALSAGGQLHALSADDGRARWSVDLIERFKSERPRFGYSPSPLVEGWLLLVQAGGRDGQSLVAFNKKTGDLVWSVFSDPAGYSSPVVAEIGGQRQIVLTRGKSLTGLALNGAVLWEYELNEPAIAMPVVVGSDRVFVSSSGDAGCALVSITRTAEGFAAESLWENRNMRNHFNSSLVIGEAIYGFDNATLKCLDLKDGTVKWAHRGFGKGSLIGVDDRLLVLTVKGALVMVEATSESYRELGMFQALEGKSWTAPSFAAGRVYLRNLTHMTCLDLEG